MRALPIVVIVASALLFATEAEAQFANRSLGLSVGYLNLNNAAGIDQGIPISLDASLYIEEGFDFVASFPLMILRDPATGRQLIGMAPQTGIRYLFSEETVRPYVQFDLSYLHIFRDDLTADFVGVGPSAGIDIFVGDTVSIGARGLFTAYLALNTPITTSMGVLIGGRTYF